MATSEEPELLAWPVEEEVSTSKPLPSLEVTDVIDEEEDTTLIEPEEEEEEYYERERPVVDAVALITSLITHEPEPLTANPDSTEEGDLRAKLLQQVLDLRADQNFSLGLPARWLVIKYLLLLLRGTRLSVPAKTAWLQCILSAWSDSDECDLWVQAYVPSLVPFLLELAPDILGPTKLQRLWWSLSPKPVPPLESLP